MSEQNGKVCANCRYNIRYPYKGDMAKIKCLCIRTQKPIDYIQGQIGWCRHWAKEKEKK